MASAPAELRPTGVSVTFALQRTGDFPRVNHVFVITTRPRVIPRPGNVLTVSTAPREITVKFALLVTMVMPHVVSHDHRRHMLWSVRHQAPYQSFFASGTTQRNNAFFFSYEFFKFHLSYFIYTVYIFFVLLYITILSFVFVHRRNYILTRKAA